MNFAGTLIRARSIRGPRGSRFSRVEIGADNIHMDASPGPRLSFPAENQERMTASVMYKRPFASGNWASTFVWGRTRSLDNNETFNSYLFESTVRFLTRNCAWTRIESAERPNELIIGENPLPPGTACGVPDTLRPIYAHPVGVAVFVRLRPFSTKSRSTGLHGKLNRFASTSQCR